MPTVLIYENITGKVQRKIYKDEGIDLSSYDISDLEKTANEQNQFYMGFSDDLELVQEQQRLLEEI